MTFFHMGGAGTVACKRCGYSEKIVSFLHGFGAAPWSLAGVQCQACGKFDGLKDDQDNTQGRRCDCGGELQRDAELFCPQCRSKDLSYAMDYTT